MAINVLATAVQSIAKKIMQRGGREHDEYINQIETEFDSRGYNTPANLRTFKRYFIEQFMPSRRANRFGGDDAQFSLNLVTDLEEIDHVKYKDRPPRDIKLGDFGVAEIDAKTRQIRRNRATIINAWQQWERLVINLVRPLLVAHDGWTYRDAIDHLRRMGELPPDLDDESAA